jgi:hypothetical protein
MDVQLVAASSAEIQGDHIAMLNAKGQLVALLLLDIVESWVVMKRADPSHAERCRIRGSVKSSGIVT